MIRIIESIADWDALLLQARESGNDIAVFKASPRCGVSFDVEHTLERWINELPDNANLLIARIDVISGRDVSNHIANALGIRHQSPQLIWLSPTGEVRDATSHWQITPNWLNDQLAG